jgi:hypothetical protein
MPGTLFCWVLWFWWWCSWHFPASGLWCCVSGKSYLAFWGNIVASETICGTWVGDTHQTSTFSPLTFKTLSHHDTESGIPALKNSVSSVCRQEVTASVADCLPASCFLSSDLAHNWDCREGRPLPRSHITLTIHKFSWHLYIQFFYSACHRSVTCSMLHCIVW